MDKDKKYYYQIDYVDKDGFSTYISTHKDRQKAIEEVGILNRAIWCISNNTKFVLDKYTVEYDEDGDPIEGILIEENITDSVTILEDIERVKSGYYKKENVMKRKLENNG